MLRHRSPKQSLKICAGRTCKWFLRRRQTPIILQHKMIPRTSISLPISVFPQTIDETPSSKEKGKTEESMEITPTASPTNPETQSSKSSLSNIQTPASPTLHPQQPRITIPSSQHPIPNPAIQRRLPLESNHLQRRPISRFRIRELTAPIIQGYGLKQMFNNARSSPYGNANMQ